MTVGVLKDSSLMGTFPITPPHPPQQATTIHMISRLEKQSYESHDTWVVPNPSKIGSLGDTMPLSPTKVSYDAI